MWTFINIFNHRGHIAWELHFFRCNRGEKRFCENSAISNAALAGWSKLLFPIILKCVIIHIIFKKVEINLLINLFQFWTCSCGKFLFVLYHLKLAQFMGHHIFQTSIFSFHVFSAQLFLKVYLTPVGLLKA